MSTGVIFGNVRKMNLVQVTLSPAQVAINTTAEQTFTFSGIRPYHVLAINKPTAQAGLGIVGVRAGTDQFFVTFSNNTAGAITPTAAEIYSLMVMQPESNVLATLLNT